MRAIANTLTASHVSGTRKRFRALAVTAALATALTACGGGGYGGSASTMSLAPTITTQPANVTVAAGQPATFSVVASSAYAITYQWLRDGATINGATAATYTLPAATAADNGARFSVVVSNAYGSVTSNAATLTVQ